jgi:glycosyltransferase involved in cell wall biosynthesis
MRLSIVTINLNRKEELKRTLSSLRAQSCKDFELLVIDGGSSDGSVELCAEFEDVISKVISERDEGIYDAWNKGIRHATGSMVGLLNAGDEYHPKVISEVFAECQSCESENFPILCGRTFIVKDGVVKKLIGNSIRRNLLLGIGVAHPAMFVPRWVYEAVGHYQRISIASDSHFILRCVKASIPFRRSNYCVYMDGTGLSHRSAEEGFEQYLNALTDLGLASRMHAYVIARAYRLYRAASRFGAVNAFRDAGANIWHLSILLLNVYQRILFFRPLRHLALRSLGFSIHRDAFVSPGITFYRPGNFEVGRGSVVNRGVLIDNRAPIVIGIGCSISHSTQLITGGHEIDSPYLEYFCRPLQIGNRVVIFARAIVLPGATLRDGVVVLPGSVIAGDTVQNGIYGGVPAKFIRLRGATPRHQLQYHRPFSL